jgi:hypothetical protein
VEYVEVMELLRRFVSGEATPPGSFAWGVHQGMRGGQYVVVGTDRRVRRGTTEVGVVSGARVRELAQVVAALLQVSAPPRDPGHQLTLDVELGGERVSTAFAPGAPEVAAAAALFTALAAEARR